MRQSRYFSFQGVTCRYVTWTSDGRDSVPKAPLVLLHGFAQSAASWDQNAPYLARDRVVHALELVGHGASTPPADAAAYALDAQAALLSAFLDMVSQEAGRHGYPVSNELFETAEPLVDGWHEPVPSKPIVVGYSMGGRIALAAACHDPRHFGALVLESAGLGPASAEERTAAAERDVCNAARLRLEGVRTFMDDWDSLPLFATQRALPAATRGRIYDERRANDVEALALSFEKAGQHTMPDRDRALNALKQGAFPLLYLVGERDRTYRLLADEVACVPRASIGVVAQVGHNTHLENPLAFRSLLTAFLKGYVDTEGERGRIL